MAKLEFTFGSMGSSKTAIALMKRFDLIESGFNVLLLKPSTDNRDGVTVIKSRIGISAEAKTYSNNESITLKYLDEILECDCVIVDEVQFSNKAQILELKQISEEFDKPVYTYGLRTDFKLNFFEGSEALFKYADVVNGVSKTCTCGNEAIVNARYGDEGIVYDGEQIVLGSNDKYKALCYTCYKKGRLHGKNRN